MQWLSVKDVIASRFRLSENSGTSPAKRARTTVHWLHSRVERSMWYVRDHPCHSLYCPLLCSAGFGWVWASVLTVLGVSSWACRAQFSRPWDEVIRVVKLTHKISVRSQYRNEVDGAQAEHGPEEGRVNGNIHLSKICLGVWRGLTYCFLHHALAGLQLDRRLVISRELWSTNRRKWVVQSREPSGFVLSLFRGHMQYAKLFYLNWGRGTGNSPKPQSHPSVPWWTNEFIGVIYWTLEDSKVASSPDHPPYHDGNPWKLYPWSSLPHLLAGPLKRVSLCPGLTIVTPITFRRDLMDLVTFWVSWAW